MYLKSLELNGFKSFAKKTSLEFEMPIVAIVGPNGSGKSNVAEAFRFVLGEQSIKSLRGKRGEDLIWNGSKTLSKQNRAAVKVVFDNRKHTFNIDFPEVVIERVVHRDGENEYLLNGSRVRLRDIIELLAGANIGASGHHIISQGEADRLLNASLKERRAMVEDALGLKVYQYKKAESERKLGKTDENIKQVEAVRKEVQPHLKFLEKQMEKVERARQLRDELTAAYREYLKREEHYIASAKRELEEGRGGPERELRESEGRMAALKKTLDASSSGDKRRARASAEEELRTIQEKLEGIRRELNKVEGMLIVSEKAFERSKDISPKEMSVPLAELERAVGEWEQELTRAERQDNIGAMRSAIAKAIASFRDFVADKRRNNRAVIERTELSGEIEKLKTQRTELNREAAAAERDVVVAAAKSRELQAEIETGEKEGRDAERELFTLMNRRNELSQNLAGLKGREESLRHEDELFRQELVEAQALVGLAALHYTDVQLPRESMNEPRHAQEERRHKLERLKIRLEEIGGGGSEIAKEYEEVKTRDEFLMREIGDLEKSAATLRELIADLSETLDNQFKEGVEKINAAFEKFFTLMFGGGSVSLSVIKAPPRRRGGATDELLEAAEEGIPVEEPEEGIDINVSLPNKRIKGLDMLSGGERALTSIALLFAISQVNPPPFIVLDETDAALDEANSKKYGEMVENLSKHSQLILITHNRETMSHAGILYGVTMGSEGASKLLSVKFDEAVAVAK